MLVTYLSLFGLCVVFLELFIRMHVVADAMAVVATSRDAVQVMASSELDDDAKEAFVRRGSLSIMKGTLRMTAKLAVIVGVLYAVFRIVAVVAPATGRELPSTLVAPVPLVAMSVATLAYAWLRGRIAGRH